jgi:hypothetical protein
MQSDPRTPWLEWLNRTEPRNSDTEEMVRLVMRLVTIRASAVGVFAGMAGATLVLVAFLLGHWVGTADGAYRAALPVVRPLAPMPAPMVVPPQPAPAQPSDPNAP